MSGFIVGIDEVGRGAIAGPLVIGAAVGLSDANNRIFLKGIRDSKKLTPQKREEWFLKFKKSEIKFYVSKISNKLIDKNGMAWALKFGVADVLKKAKIMPEMVYLDGGLRAPEKYRQKTIIGGDDKIAMISAASVYAKVYRDHLMVEMIKQYPYNFNTHKGYGTRGHFERIGEKGVSPVHRKTFLKNLSKYSKLIK